MVLLVQSLALGSGEAVPLVGKPVEVEVVCGFTIENKNRIFHQSG